MNRLIMCGFYIMLMASCTQKQRLSSLQSKNLKEVNFVLSQTKNMAHVIEEKLEKHRNKFPTGDIDQIDHVKVIIDYMYNFDQELRNLFIKDQNNKQLASALKTLDLFHTQQMKEILKVHGWIVVSKFGLKYDKKAWLLIQHADEDPFFQAGVLCILEKMVNKKETDAKNYAYLYDRVAGKFHQIGFLQKYGTQVDFENENIKLQPYEGSLEDIDNHRKAVGLEPLGDYLEKIKEISNGA